MTQEDKELLLKDLCARQPYGVKVNAANKYISTISSINIGITTLILLKDVSPVFGIDDVKPYLRPLSSMTMEECVELSDLYATMENVGEHIPNIPYYFEIALPDQIDWFNAHHFDYRGLIEKGLALEAPVDMYKTE